MNKQQEFESKQNIFFKIARGIKTFTSADDYSGFEKVESIQNGTQVLAVLYAAFDEDGVRCWVAVRPNAALQVNYNSREVALEIFRGY